MTTLFIGSSQIEQWPLPKTVSKCAKTGILTRDLFRLPLKKHAFSRIVLYCGSNDILAGLDPVDNIVQFVHRLHRAYPRSDITVLAILKTPFAKKFHEVITSVNARLKRGLGPYIHFVNRNRVLMHPKYYREDGLHLNEAGYDVWERAI